MFKWKKGRQNDNYERVKLFESELLKADVYLIRVKPLGIIPPHTDTVKSGKHFRFNITIGGLVTYIEGVGHSLPYLFRPDIQQHMARNHAKEYAYMLSFGKVI